MNHDKLDSVELQLFAPSVLLQFSGHFALIRSLFWQEFAATSGHRGQEEALLPHLMEYANLSDKGRR